MLTFEMKFNTCNIWLMHYNGYGDYVGKLEQKSSQTRLYWVFNPSYSFCLEASMLEQILDKIKELESLHIKEDYFKHQKELLDGSN